MTENRSTLQEYAMRYGTAMGIFWACKFVLFPLGMNMPLLLVFFFILTLAVPVLGYVFARKYREQQCEGTLNFSKAYIFTIFMYIFASLLVAVIHYFYFRYMDNGLIVNTYQGMIDQMTAISTEEMRVSLEQFSKALDVISSLTPLEITMQLLTQNVFYCSMLAIPTALLVMRNKKKQ
jgi:heme/copper-type cytochrome/quinol oxidase subunit 2